MGSQRSQLFFIGVPSGTSKVYKVTPMSRFVFLRSRWARGHHWLGDEQATVARTAAGGEPAPAVGLVSAGPPSQPAGSIYDPDLHEFTRVNTNVFTVSNLFVLSGLVGHITWALETGMARRARGVVWRA